MKHGKQLFYGEAIKAAEKIMATIRMNCERIEVTGSLRYKKPEGMIELIGIAKSYQDTLFGHQHRNSVWIVADLARAGYEIRFSSDEYIWFMAPVRGSTEKVGCMLYLTTPEQWGLTQAIKTGPAAFANCLMTGKRTGGFLPEDMHLDKDHLYRGDQVVEIREESDLFTELGLAYIPPQMRSDFIALLNSMGINLLRAAEISRKAVGDAV